MGTAHTNSQESVVEKEEKRRAENMYFIDRIERAIETYREECETSKKPEAMRCYRGSVRILHSGGRKDGCSDCK